MSRDRARKAAVSVRRFIVSPVLTEGMARDGRRRRRGGPRELREREKGVELEKRITHARTHALSGKGRRGRCSLSHRRGVCYATTYSLLFLNYQIRKKEKCAISRSPDRAFLLCKDEKAGPLPLFPPPLSVRCRGNEVGCDDGRGAH